MVQGAKKLLLLFLFFGTIKNSVAQSVGIGTTSPTASALLDVRSTTKGAVLPRMTSTQRKAIASPTAGLMVYDNSTASYWYYSNAGWKEFSTGVNNSDSSLIYGQQTGSLNSYNLLSAGGTTSDSSGYLYDSGGPNANYSNNESTYFVLIPPANAVQLRVQFLSWQTESPYDSMQVKDLATYNVLRTFFGTGIPTVFYTASHNIAIEFYSNNVNTAAGFKLKWDWIFVKNSTQNAVAPNNGWIYIPEKFAVCGGLNAHNNWHKDSVGMYSFSYGYQNKANGNNSLSIGINNLSGGESCISMGNFALAPYDNSVAIGTYAQTNSYASTAVGYGCYAGGNSSSAFGNRAVAAGEGATAIGFSGRAYGAYSLALGKESIANGYAAVALGDSSIASKYAAVAIGYKCIASGEGSTAMGVETEALGGGSTAMGLGTRATELYSTAAGYNSQARGVGAYANGNNAWASGYFSFANGTYVSATGDYSTALGTYVNTTGYEGSMALGDHSTSTVMQSFVANGFRARFAGGYRLFTNSDANIGAVLNSGSNSWAALSDVLDTLDSLDRIY